MTAVLGWSITNLILKITRATALAFAFWRLWLGAAVMAIILLVLRRKLTRSMVAASVVGGLVFGLNIAAFFMALKATAIADVLVIQALQPALVLMVAAPLFGERIGPWDVMWTVVSVGGVVLVTVGASGTPVWSLRGDVLAVVSLLFWTAYLLVSKRARRQVPAVEYMSIVTITAALVVTPLALASGGPLLALRWQDWAWLGVFLVAAQGGHVLVAWAHSQVDVSISVLLILAQPVIAVAAAYFILDEPLRPLEIAGGLVVIASVGFIVRRAAMAGEADELAPEPQAA